MMMRRASTFCKLGVHRPRESRNADNDPRVGKPAHLRQAAYSPLYVLIRKFSGSAPRASLNNRSEFSSSSAGTFFAM
jgi:hypothetical protein